MTNTEKRITELQRESGVYWVTWLWWSIYVGKSNNIGQRLRGHVRNGSDLGKYLERRPNATIHHVTRWQSLEVPLIRMLRPRLNKQHNPRRKKQQATPMTPTPVYDPQTRTHQRRVLKGRGHAGRVWIAC
jgi:excinuclease UvrABC nuclease subunit